MHAFLSTADFFFKFNFFGKKITGIPLECQTFWVQIRAWQLFGSDLRPNCLKMSSADDTGRQEAKEGYKMLTKSQEMLFTSIPKKASHRQTTA